MLHSTSVVMSSWGIKEERLNSPSMCCRTVLVKVSQQPPTLTCSGGLGDRHPQNKSNLFSLTVNSQRHAYWLASLFNSSPTWSWLNEAVVSTQVITMETSRPSLSADLHFIGSLQMPTRNETPKRLSMRLLSMSLLSSSHSSSAWNTSWSTLPVETREEWLARATHSRNNWRMVS